MQALYRAAAPLAVAILLTLTMFVGFGDAPEFASLEATKIGDSQMELLTGMPVSFEPNAGHLPAETKFLGRSHMGAIHLQNDKIVIVAAGELAEVEVPAGHELIDGHELPAVSLPHTQLLTFFIPSTEPIGDRQNNAVTSSYVGPEENWVESIPNFDGVRYPDVYPGIDLLFYATQDGQLEFDFIVQPGVSPDQIRLQFDAQSATLVDGALHLGTPGGVFVLDAPYSYQQEEVASQFILDGNSFGFALGEYDKNALLVIDPILDFSTYWGGSSTEYGQGIAVLPDDSFYIAGRSLSSNMPLKDEAYGDSTSWDGFLTRIDKDGNLISSTYMGSDCTYEYEYIHDVAANGNDAYLIGHVYGPLGCGFPLRNEQDASPGGFDLWVGKFKDGKTLEWGTYIGSDSNWEYGSAIDVTSAGEAVIFGVTDSKTFPMQNAHQDTNKGGYDFILAKLKPDGSDFIFSTYLGGSSTEYGLDTYSDQFTLANSLALDSSGNILITGDTYSSNFPLKSEAATYVSGREAIVAKFTPAGELTWSTYVSGSFDQYGRGVAGLPNGDVAMVGYTTGNAGFTTKNEYQAYQGSNDGIIAVIPSAGGAFTTLTYFGGASVDRFWGVETDTNGDLVASGYTLSGTGFPLAGNIGGPTQTYGSYDMFAIRIDPKMERLQYSTLMGTNGADYTRDMDLDSNGMPMIIGSVSGSTMPIVKGFASAGSWEAAVWKPIYIPPSANAVYTPDDPCTEEPMEFSGEYAYSEAPLLTAGWDLDDDGIVDDPSATLNVLLAPGDYVYNYVVEWMDGTRIVEPFSFSVDANLVGPEEITATGTQTVQEGETVSMSALAIDPDGDTPTYSWLQIGGPIVELSGANGPNPTFIAPDVERNGLTYEAIFQVGASDGCSTVIYPENLVVTIININVPPVADAGPDTTTNEGQIASINGFDSYDHDGDELSFLWTVLEGQVELEDPTAAAVSFQSPPIEGYSSKPIKLQLQVEDGWGGVSFDTINIRVIGSGDTGSASSGGGGGGSPYGGTGGYSYNPLDSSAGESGCGDTESAQCDDIVDESDPTPVEADGGDEWVTVDTSTPAPLSIDEDPRYAGYNVYVPNGTMNSTGDAIGIHATSHDAPGLPIVILLAAIIGIVLVRRK